MTGRHRAAEPAPADEWAGEAGDLGAQAIRAVPAPRPPLDPAQRAVARRALDEHAEPGTGWFGGP